MAKQYAQAVGTTTVSDIREAWRAKLDQIGARKAPIFTSVMRGVKPNNPEIRWTAHQIKIDTLQEAPDQSASLPPEQAEVSTVYSNYSQQFHATTSVGDYAEAFKSVSGDASMAWQVMQATERVYQRTELAYLDRQASKKPTADRVGTMSSVLNYLNDNREAPSKCSPAVHTTLATGLTTPITGTTGGGSSDPIEMDEDEFSKVIRKINEQGVGATTMSVISAPGMYAKLGQFPTANERRSIIDTNPGKQGATISDHVGVYITRYGFVCKLVNAPFMRTHDQKTANASNGYDVLVLDMSRLRTHIAQGMKFKRYGPQSASEAGLVTWVVTHSVGNPKGHGSFVGYGIESA